MPTTPSTPPRTDDSAQLPIVWEPAPALVERLRRAAVYYLWIAPLLREAAIEKGR